MHEWKPDVVIYHDPCDDGFASAWVAQKKWGSGLTMVPANYGQAIPDEDILSGKNVLIADFSYPKEELEALAAIASEVVVLDHHKTAAAALGAFPMRN